MKNLILTLSTIFVLGVSNINAQNSNDLVTSINQKNNDTIEVFLQKQSADVVKVNIYGKTGVLLNRNTLRKENIKKYVYDISSFPAGVYTLEIVNNNSVISQFNIDNRLPQQIQIASVKE